MLYSLTNMKIISRLKGIDPSNLKYDKLLEKIVSNDKNKSVSNEIKCSMTDILGSKLFYDIIISSYLKPLSSQNNENKNCKLGHDNDKKLVKNLFRDHKRILQETGLDTIYFYDTGIIKIRKLTMLKEQ